jgi:hypothetical protein
MLESFENNLLKKKKEFEKFSKDSEESYSTSSRSVQEKKKPQIPGLDLSNTQSSFPSDYSFTTSLDSPYSSSSSTSLYEKSKLSDTKNKNSLLLNNPLTAIDIWNLLLNSSILINPEKIELGFERYIFDSFFSNHFNSPTFIEIIINFIESYTGNRMDFEKNKKMFFYCLFFFYVVISILCYVVILIKKCNFRSSLFSDSGNFEDDNNIEEVKGKAKFDEKFEEDVLLLCLRAVEFISVNIVKHCFGKRRKTENFGSFGKRNNNNNNNDNANSIVNDDIEHTNLYNAFVSRMTSLRTVNILQKLLVLYDRIGNERDVEFDTTITRVAKLTGETPELRTIIQEKEVIREKAREREKEIRRSSAVIVVY